MTRYLLAWYVLAQLTVPTQVGQPVLRYGPFRSEEACQAIRHWLQVQYQAIVSPCWPGPGVGG